MGSKEILTLQLGHYANFVGTHFWNIQEHTFDYTQPSNINHDVLYRQGLNSKGEITYTPRLLLVDLKDSLRSLSQEGNLYESSNTECEWGSVEVKKEEINASSCQTFLNKGKHDANFNLDEQVTVWSDFLISRFHPRTVNVIQEYQHNNSNTPFDVYTSGKNLWKTEQFHEEFADKIRNYIEECDSFQGFHCLFDIHNAFSGLSISCIQYLKDEYSTKSVFALPLLEPIQFNDPLKDTVRILNLGLCFDSLVEFSSIFSLLSTAEKGWRQPGPKRAFHHTIYNNDLPYHSSAILASALDTFTLRHRLKTENYTLTDLTIDLTANGRKAVAASLCLPFSMDKRDDFIDCLNSWNGPLSRSLTPNCDIGEDKLVQVYTLRGVSENRLKKQGNDSSSRKQRNFPAYKCENVKEMLEYYVACNSFASLTNVTVVNKALSTKIPYPAIFDEFVTIDGNIDFANNKKGFAESIPVLSGLHNGIFLGSMIDSLSEEMGKIKIKRFPHFCNEGIDTDEYKECLSRIKSFKECYEDSYFI